MGSSQSIFAASSEAQYFPEEWIIGRDYLLYPIYSPRRIPVFFFSNWHQMFHRQVQDISLQLK